MRWSLRYQFLAPTLGVMLLAFAAVAVAQTLFAMWQAEEAIQTRLQEVAETLNETSFPLSDPVLTQMSGLTGAEYAVADADGKLLARSAEAITLTPDPVLIQQPDSIELSAANRQFDPQYFALVVDLQRKSSGREPVRLHIYYPVESWRQARQQAALPTLLIGGIALLCQMVLAAAIAQRVVSPLQSLTRRVNEIADGDYRPIPPPNRNDEIHDLVAAVNQMSTKLSDYADAIRRSERLRTLGQLGGGIAHHLRNAATGCRLALDFHRAECTSGDEENVRVAMDQLAVMERHLQRFLHWGKTSSQPYNAANASGDGRLDPSAEGTTDSIAAPIETTTINASDEVRRIIDITQPTAKHLQVELTSEISSDSIYCHCEAEGFSEAVTNLLVNAIEAAAESDRSASRAVAVSVRNVNSKVQIEVADSGVGPPDEIDIYEPLVSQKPSGTGLGLAVAKSFAEQSGGTLSHRREEGKTLFTLVLPASSNESKESGD